ncbi:TonB-dependent receptor [Granulicella arctica]|uniref:TonB-dependent receptor n=1 Tax=Granulicella arctica TaxID=940613 RepID=UPI0021E08BFC|nr:TonB-dependent receptor [Granulicella arctica]
MNDVTRQSLAALGQRVFLGIAILVAVLLLAAPVAHAQFDNGSAVGTIHDASGAAVPNATVKITNTATAISTETTTNASGDYEVPTLKVGVYTIAATAPGFSDTVAQNVTVSVGGRTHIDLTLKVGSASTTVEVSDVTLQLETESSERGQTITNYQSEALPLVSRNYSDLLGLVTGSRQAPTAATTSSINSLVRAGAYNINGQRSMFNNFLLDGLDNNAYGESNQGFDNQIIAVPPDSVAQFQVVTNNESAEFGRSSGATINVASNSGTNKYHATLYEFFRNTDLNAAGFFKPTSTGTSGIVVPFKKPTFNRNQYGVNFGGPIVEDKLFFFLDYEGFRQVLKPLSVLTLPTQNELNGVLVAPVRNPLTGKVYAAGSTIPTSDINPLSRQIITAFRQVPISPVPGAPGTGLAQFNYAVQVPFTDNSDKGDLRFDYQQNPSTSWFLRVSDRKENALNSPALPLPLDGQTNGKIRVLDQQAVLGFTRLFGSDKVLDARVGLSRTKAGKFSTSIGSTSFNIPGLPTDPSVSGGLPTTTINGFTGFGRQSTNPQFQNPALLDPKINFTYVKGRHSMKFGYEYEHVWMAVSDNNPLFGSFTYGGGYSACPAGTIIPGVGTCSAAAGTPAALSSAAVSDTFWADFLFGTTSGYSAANVFTTHLRQTFHSAYAQDDWKALPNLTLNLGLRWEYGSPYAEQNNFVSNFDPISQTVLTTTPGATGAAITSVSPSGGVYNSTLVNPDLNDFAPRAGFAYAPDGKTAIRGGFGMSFVHYTRAGSGDILGINAPQALFVAVNQNNLKPTPTNHCTGSPTVAQIGNVAGGCYVSAEQGFPTGLTTTFNPLTDNVTYVPRNTRDSYVESYFLSVQRELAKNTRLDIAYVGNHSLKLQGFINANQLNPAVGFAQANRPFPKFSDITEALNEFSGNYNSLQVRYEQRFVAGLTVLNSFTWSQALDQTSASLEGNTPSVQDANNLRADYGQSDYNLPIANITSLIYELPVGHGRRFLSTSNGFVDAALGGWQLSTINTMQSGTPFNLTYSPAATNSVSPTISNSFRGANLYRPNVNPGVKQILNTQIASSGFIQYVNPAAFALPGTTANGVLQSPFGNAARNPLRNTPFYQTDLSLNKRFTTPVEGLKVEFRTEFYNILNHTNLYLPSTIGGTNGANASTGGIISSTFEPRIIQFGLKVLY